MRSIVMLPILLLGFFIQISIINQFEILSGFANLILLILICWATNTTDLSYLYWALFAGIIFSFISAVPPIIPIVSFIGASVISRRIAKVTWQVPIITLIFATMVGGLFEQFFSISSFWLASNFSLNIIGMVTNIALPSLFLDLLLVIPVNSIVRDIALWAMPKLQEA